MYVFRCMCGHLQTDTLATAHHTLTCLCLRTDVTPEVYIFAACMLNQSLQLFFHLSYRYCIEVIVWSFLSETSFIV